MKIRRQGDSGSATLGGSRTKPSDERQISVRVSLSHKKAAAPGGSMRGDGLGHKLHWDWQGLFSSFLVNELLIASIVEGVVPK